MELLHHLRVKLQSTWQIPLQERGVKLIGTDCAAIEKAENRDAFEKLLSELSIPQPKGQAVTDIEKGN